MNPDVFDEEEGGTTRARWFKRAGLVVGFLVTVGLVVAVIGNLMANTGPVSYTHLTLPTIYSV